MRVWPNSPAAHSQPRTNFPPLTMPALIPVFHINHIFGRCCCAHRPLCYGLGASYVFHQGWKAKLLLEDLLKRKVPDNGG